MRHTLLRGSVLVLTGSALFAIACGDDAASVQNTATGAGPGVATGGATTNPGNGGSQTGITATGGSQQTGNSATGGTQNSSSSNTATGGSQNSSSSNTATGGSQNSSSNSATGGSQNSSSSNTATGGTQNNSSANSQTGGTSSSSSSSSATGGTTSSSNSAAAGTTSATSNASTTSWTFGADVQKWTVSWGDPEAVKTGTTLTWDSAVGSTLNGSLSLSIPFTDKSQKLQVAVAWASAADLTGKTVRAKIRLDAGLNCGDFKGGAKLFVKWVETAAGGTGGSTSTESWYYSDSGWIDLTAGTTWTSLSFDGSGNNTSGWTETDKTYKPTLVRQIGIEISTNGDAAAANCTAATLHIDDVSY